MNIPLTGQAIARKNNYTLVRRWQDHPFFGNEPYSRRDAWCWLIENACFRDAKANISGKVVLLKRVQLSFSIRFLAQKWRWDKAKVDRFLRCLKTEAMIETHNETGQNIITICNYGAYQLTPDYIETANETQSETQARRQRDRSETKKNTLNTLNTENSFVLPSWIPLEPWQAFLASRIKSRATNTPYALGLIVNDLQKFRTAGHDPAVVLNNSIMNGWKGVFPPKQTLARPEQPQRRNLQA